MKEMENSGQNEKPQSSLEERMQAVDGLSKKFGSSSKIPEEDLSALGYVRRVLEDGTVRLIPSERLQELAQKGPDWEKPLKTRERPFGRIAVELPTSEHSFRFIPRTQRQLLSARLEAVEYAFYPNWHDGTSITGELDKTDSRIHNLRTFSLDLLDYIREHGIDGRKLPENIAQDLIFGALPVRKEAEEWDPDDPNDFESDAFREKYSEEDNSVSSAASRQMYNELTRLDGYFTDLTELTRDFQNRLTHPIIPDDKRQSQHELADYLEAHGIQTYADFIRYLFPRYLKYAGLSEIAAVIGKTTTFHTIADALQQTDALDSSRTEEQELRNALKSTTPEERNILSGQMKDLENQKRKRRQIRQGVIDYFSSPQIYAQVCKRKIKEAQDFLVGGKGEQKGRALFYLDATPNEQLDKDPGLVSGDCTAGKPLPFDRSDIPAYNVKVFADGDQHVGNMYLLVTSTSSDTSEKKKAWHFDAMQIPRSGINWRESVDMMITTLAKQAEAKGIDAITANSELHQISNYDYIAYAVKYYWDRHGRQMVDVTIPEVNESEHSSFQGTGEAIVLWSKEKLSDVYEGELKVDQGLFDLQNNQ